MSETMKYEACPKCGLWNKGCLAEMIGAPCTVEAHKQRILTAVKKHRNVFKLLGDPRPAA